MRGKYAWLSLLACLGVLLGVNIGYAQNSNYTRAKFEDYENEETVRVRPNGLTPDQSPDEYGDMISDTWRSDLLWVAGRGAWANLSFWDAQNRLLNPLVEVGKSESDTVYGFPCRVKQAGSGTFGWGFENVDEVCDTVTANVCGNEEISVSSKTEIQKIANGELSSRQISIARSADKTLIHIYSIADALAVDTLVGAAQVTSPDGATVDVSAGKRYVQSAETGNIESINLKEAAESPSVENFLDEANWSSDVESLLDDFKLQIQVIHTHNDLRAKVDVPPLSWSPELAELAQEWADELSRRGNRSLDHRDDRPSGTGENAAAGGAVDTMLDLWSEEENNYNPSTGQCRPGTTCDHYSQMVWRNTTEIGCGIAPHRVYRRVMVCNYSPPGNFVGERAY